MDGYEPCIKCKDVIDDWYMEDDKFYCHDCSPDADDNTPFQSEKGDGK